MRKRMLGALAAVAMVSLVPGLAPTGVGAAPPSAAVADANVPIIGGGALVDATNAANAAGIELADGGLSTAAATVTSLTLNGGQFTVRPGSTGNTLTLNGNGFTPVTEYLIITAYGPMTITNINPVSPTQQIITFDVPVTAKGIAFLLTAEPAETVWTPVVAFQVYIGVGAFFPLSTPARVLDSRVGIGGQSAPLSPNSAWTVPVAGQAGIPADATAVSVNLTAIGNAGGGFLSLYPAGGTRPDVSTVNFGGGYQVVPNHAIVPLGAGGALELFNGAGDPVNALIDVDGYYSGQDVTGGLLYWDEMPSRVLDMRASGITVQPDSTMTFRIVPPERSWLEGGDVADVNVTITNQTGVGFASVYPSGAARPNASTHNWIAPMQDTANRVAARVGADGLVTIYNGSTGTFQVIVDYFGAWSPVIGYRFTPVTPHRVVDTRTIAKLGPSEGRTLNADAWVNVAPTPWMVVGNLTGDQPTSATFFQLWTGNLGSPPQPSNLNLQAGETRANSFIAANSFSSATVNLRNAFGYTHAIIDVSGYFDD
jgi:hypothetical protein